MAENPPPHLKIINLDKNPDCIREIEDAYQCLRFLYNAPPCFETLSFNNCKLSPAWDRVLEKVWIERNPLSPQKNQNDSFPLSLEDKGRKVQPQMRPDSSNLLSIKKAFRESVDEMMFDGWSNDYLARFEYLIQGIEKELGLIPPFFGREYWRERVNQIHHYKALLFSLGINYVNDNTLLFSDMWCTLQSATTIGYFTYSGFVDTLKYQLFYSQWLSKGIPAIYPVLEDPHFEVILSLYQQMRACLVRSCPPTLRAFLGYSLEDRSLKSFIITTLPSAVNSSILLERNDHDEDQPLIDKRFNSKLLTKTDRPTRRHRFLPAQEPIEPVEFIFLSPTPKKEKERAESLSLENAEVPQTYQRNNSYEDKSKALGDHVLKVLPVVEVAPLESIRRLPLSPSQLFEKQLQGRLIAYWHAARLLEYTDLVKPNEKSHPALATLQILFLFAGISVSVVEASHGFITDAIQSEGISKVLDFIKESAPLWHAADAGTKLLKMSGIHTSVEKVLSYLGLSGHKNLRQLITNIQTEEYLIGFAKAFTALCKNSLENIDPAFLDKAAAFIANHLLTQLQHLHFSNYNFHDQADTLFQATFTAIWKTRKSEKIQFRNTNINDSQTRSVHAHEYFTLQGIECLYRESKVNFELLIQVAELPTIRTNGPLYGYRQALVQEVKGMKRGIIKEQAIQCQIAESYTVTYLYAPIHQREFSENQGTFTLIECDQLRCNSIEDRPMSVAEVEKELQAAKAEINLLRNDLREAGNRFNSLLEILSIRDPSLKEALLKLLPEYSSSLTTILPTGEFHPNSSSSMRLSPKASSSTPSMAKLIGNRKDSPRNSASPSKAALPTEPICEEADSTYIAHRKST